MQDCTTISAPFKRGTIWVRNIVHPLLSGGSADFESIYDVVLWPESSSTPAALPARFLKSHTRPSPPLYSVAGEGPDVKCVVVCAVPRKRVSFKQLLGSHTDVRDRGRRCRCRPGR